MALTVPESAVAVLRQQNAEIEARLKREVLRFFSGLDLSRPDQARDALLDYIPFLTDGFGDISAVVSADWFDEIRMALDIPGTYVAEMADPFPAQFVRERIRYGAAHLYTDTPEQIIPFIQDIVQEYALQPGRDTIAQSVLRDPNGRGWQRHTSAGACKFCRVLAGRGGVYTKDSVTFASHGGCGCVAKPSWDPNAPEVPVEAYVASERTSRMNEEQKAEHRARVKAFMAQMDD